MVHHNIRTATNASNEVHSTWRRSPRKNRTPQIAPTAPTALFTLPNQVRSTNPTTSLKSPPDGSITASRKNSDFPQLKKAAKSISFDASSSTLMNVGNFYIDERKIANALAIEKVDGVIYSGDTERRARKLVDSMKDKSLDELS
jgi:hypothetical protein